MTGGRGSGFGAAEDDGAAGPDIPASGSEAGSDE